MLLRAALLNRGNPFARYSRSRIMARADFTEKELEALVKPHVTKEGTWNGPLPENYYHYTDYIADISGSTHPGWKPIHAYGTLAAMFVGLFSLHQYYQSQPERAAERPYIRKQFPYNGLYLERGGDPEKLHLLPAIDSEVHDPYPYYGENSIDYKAKHGGHKKEHH